MSGQEEMSEPVSKAGTEDVLASIRRLVSENDHPPRGQGAAREETRGTGGRPEIAGVGGRLVLTPSFRVGAADINPEGRRVDAEEEAAGTGRDPVASDRSPEEGDTGGGESDRANRPQDDRSGVLMLDETVRLPDDAGQVEDPPDQLDRIDARPAAEVAAVSSDAPIVDGGDARTGLRHPRERRDPAATTEAADSGKLQTTPTEHAVASPLGAKIAALEAAIARKDDTWEPDGIGGDDLSGTTLPAMGWDDDGPRAPLRLEPEDRSDDPEAGPPVEAFDTESSVASEEIVDEAALRELVADIVRQELSGELGERITRNVRKLVRREIQRALIAKDFD